MMRLRPAIPATTVIPSCSLWGVGSATCGPQEALAEASELHWTHIGQIEVRPRGRAGHRRTAPPPRRAVGC